MKTLALLSALTMSLSTFATVPEYRNQERTECLTILDESIAEMKVYEPTMEQAYALAEMSTLGIPGLVKVVAAARAPFMLKKLEEMNQDSLDHAIESATILEESNINHEVDHVLSNYCKL